MSNPKTPTPQADDSAGRDDTHNTRDNPRAAGAASASDALFFGWLSGFIDGESCFMIRVVVKVESHML